MKPDSHDKVPSRKHLLPKYLKGYASTIYMIFGLFFIYFLYFFSYTKKMKANTIKIILKQRKTYRKRVIHEGSPWLKPHHEVRGPISYFASPVDMGNMNNPFMFKTFASIIYLLFALSYP